MAVTLPALLLMRLLRPLTVEAVMMPAVDTGTTACPPGPRVATVVFVEAAAAACCWACTAAALAAATAAIAAEVTEDELATGDAPVVAEAGDGFVKEENVVITQRAAPEDWPSSEGQTKSLL